MIALVLGSIIGDLNASKEAHAGIAMILLYGLALYVLAGLVTAILFVIFGVTQVLPHSAGFDETISPISSSHALAAVGAGRDAGLYAGAAAASTTSCLSILMRGEY